MLRRCLNCLAYFLPNPCCRPQLLSLAGPKELPCAIHLASFIGWWEAACRGYSDTWWYLVGLGLRSVTAPPWLYCVFKHVLSMCSYMMMCVLFWCWSQSTFGPLALICTLLFSWEWREGVKILICSGQQDGPLAWEATENSVFSCGWGCLPAEVDWSLLAEILADLRMGS